MIKEKSIVNNKKSMDTLIKKSPFNVILHLKDKLNKCLKIIM